MLLGSAGEKFECCKICYLIDRYLICVLLCSFSLMINMYVILIFFGSSNGYDHKFLWGWGVSLVFHCFVYFIL